LPGNRQLDPNICGDNLRDRGRLGAMALTRSLLFKMAARRFRHPFRLNTGDIAPRPMITLAAANLIECCAFSSNAYWPCLR
jgi:hypothetical protein